MKPLSHLITVLCLLAVSGPSVAQTSNPPSTQVSPSSNNSGVVSDGISVYRGQAYLLRNGRAAAITRALVPEGKFLTWEGGLSPLPSGFSVYDNISAERDGFMVFHNQTFWLHGGNAALLNNKVVPEGQVLTPSGQLVALPSDFSGFVHDRTAAGATGPMTTDLGTQALPNQAGVPQMNQGTDLRPSAAPNLPAGGTNPNMGVNGTVSSTSGGAGVNSSGVIPDGNGGFINADNVIVSGGGLTNGGVQGTIGAGVNTNMPNGVSGVNSAQTRTGGVNANLPAATQGTRANVNGTNGTSAATSTTPTARTAGGAPATTAGGTAANTAGAAQSTNAAPAGGAQTGTQSRGRSAPTGNSNGGGTAPAGNPNGGGSAPSNGTGGGR